MQTLQTKRSLSAIAVLVLSGVTCAAGLLTLSTMAAAAPRRTLEGWSSLTLSASKALIFSASATLQASESQWPGNGKRAVVLKTRSQARILGATGFEEETTSWIDHASHRPLEFFQLRPGDNARRFVFLEAGVRETTWEPPPSHRDSDFSKWSEVETVDRKVTFADGKPPDPTEPLTDFYSLIYLLGDLDPSSSQPREFNTLYRRRVVRVRVTPMESRRREMELVNEATGDTERLKLSERRIEIKPLGEAAAGFRGILGMQGDTEIWIDEASGALLEINGNAPGLGATQILLTSFRR